MFDWLKTRLELCKEIEHLKNELFIAENNIPPLGTPDIKLFHSMEKRICKKNTQLNEWRIKIQELEKENALFLFRKDKHIDQILKLELEIEKLKGTLTEQAYYTKPTGDRE